MSRYVDIEPMIEDIYTRWGGDPKYHIGSSPEGQSALWDAQLIEFLNQQPSIDIKRCKECRYWVAWEGCKFPCGLRSTSDNCFCSFAKRRRKSNE